jgi:copper chaperone CopZ
MTCTGCEATLRKVLGLVEGVADARADHTSGRVAVTFDPAVADLDDIRAAIEQAGYDVVG